MDENIRAAKAKSVPVITTASNHFQFNYNAVSASCLASKPRHEFDALRLSRRDNPFLKDFFSSRDNIVTETDRLFPMENEMDPFSLPEVHQFLIRSPPPTTWPSCDNLSSTRCLNTSAIPLNKLSTSLNSSHLHIGDNYNDKITIVKNS